jgi:hypothetical protein
LFRNKTIPLLYTSPHPYTSVFPQIKLINHQTPARFMKQSIQHKAGFTDTLHTLQHKLSAAGSPQTRRQAALTVMEAYNDIYSQYGVQAKLDLMEEATNGISPMPLLSNAERQEVLNFCRFTRLLAEAAAMMVGGDELKDGE